MNQSENGLQNKKAAPASGTVQLQRKRNNQQGWGRRGGDRARVAGEECWRGICSQPLFKQGYE